MAYFLIKGWPERLYYVKRNNVIFRTAKVPLEFVPVTRANIDLVIDLRGEGYKNQFEYQLSLGDYGLYAFHDGRAVGYGWVKRPGSDDFFYKIEDGVRYLCRFFVQELSRGKGIYPELICRLIDHEQLSDDFYIDIETGNVSSEKGLLKVGFEFVHEFRFIRGFKHTFNKKELKKK